MTRKPLDNREKYLYDRYMIYMAVKKVIAGNQLRKYFEFDEHTINWISKWNILKKIGIKGK